MITRLLVVIGITMTMRIPIADADIQIVSDENIDIASRNIRHD